MLIPLPQKKLMNLPSNKRIAFAKFNREKFSDDAAVLWVDGTDESIY